MNIVSTQYTLEYKALEIYLSGCSGVPKCKGCHNPDLWDFNLGEPWEYKLDYIKNKIIESDNLIDNIWILGGEPLDQDIHELLSLLRLLSDTKKTIWLFTRYEFIDIPKIILPYIDYIKTGKYDNSKLSENNMRYGIKLASKNQDIVKIIRK